MLLHESNEALRRVNLLDIPRFRELAQESYHDSLLMLCLETIDFHEQCLRYGLDDGRQLYLYTLRDGTRVAGCCGLHRYIWGPRDICWASWFFVRPEYRKSGVPQKMFLALLNQARNQGFKRLFVETPTAHPSYSRISLLLPRLGFVLEARFSGFYAPDVDQLIFSMRL
jgi:GNAT superfamily N-acetyltransferase